MLRRTQPQMELDETSSDVSALSDVEG